MTETPPTPFECQEAIEYLTQFEQTIREIECNVLGKKNSEAVIMHLLQRAGAFYHADRAYIIEVDWDLDLGTNTREWCANGTAPQKENLLNIDMEPLSRWKNAFLERQPIIIDNIPNIRIKSPEEYELLKKQDIQCLLAVPLNRKMAGYLGVDNPKRYLHYASMLQALSYAIASELTEKNLMQTVALKSSQYPKIQSNELIINFLGGLEVISPIGVLNEEKIKSPLSCQLLAYLCLNRGRAVSVRDIANRLWPNQLVDDPGKAVRNVVYRIRKIFDVICPEHIITYNGRGYEINRCYQIQTDIEKFEVLCATAGKESRFEQGLELYRSALGMYKGSVLPNLDFIQWLMPTVTYYHLLYLECVKQCLNKMQNANLYFEVYHLASHALKYESSDSDLHFYLIQSLLKQGAVDEAQKHYYGIDSQLNEQEKKRFQNLLFST